MVRGRAVISTLIFGIALLICVSFLLQLAPGGGRRVVRAEFADAFPLVPGDDVLMWGAKVGSVGSMKLTGHGTVSVEIRLLDGVTRPRQDASVSVRAGDLLGSAYLDLSPGRSAAPLRGPIPVSRSFVATSIQDYLNSYDEPTRKAFSVLLDELGVALEGRGIDLNRAVLQLAPALDAATRLASQVGAENASLEGLIVHARAVTKSVAPRSADLERLIDGFDRTFQATAGNAQPLNRGLATFPAALAQTRSTLTQLQGTAEAATPLADQLLAAAPALATAMQRLGPFATQTTRGLSDLRPLVRSLGSTLSAGSRAFPRLAVSLRQIATAAPSIVRFDRIFNPLISYFVKGMIGGLGRLGGEPGAQQVENAPGRNWFRTVGVLGCESFGVPTAPGCMASLLQRTAGAQAPQRRRVPAHPNVAPRPSAPGTGAGASGTAPGSSPTVGVPSLPAVPQVPAAPGGVAAPDRSINSLLDYLLGR
jgi:phospholipid/cholesterol/gamma-HCH transport system substrate-binding protein